MQLRKKQKKNRKKRRKIYIFKVATVRCRRCVRVVCAHNCVTACRRGTKFLRVMFETLAKYVTVLSIA